MRYDNWDVILFPRDSLVPIQEFRTACFTSQDEQGRQLPTLTCYIASLPTSTPFRISIHSWSTSAKPSALIESRRKASQKVVYTVQVIVDGARVFHGFYETTSKWPQEIVHEKRSISDTHLLSSQRSPFLEFPRFDQNILMQSSWDARENSGRIKVLLSEQLIRKPNIPGELDFGASTDVVCFAFQHAPQDILEQAGISWPIRNPLYLPHAIGPRGHSSSQIPMPYTKARDLAVGKDSEPYARPRTDPPPRFSRFAKPGLGSLSWNASTEGSISDDHDDVSMDSWATRRATSHSNADISMPDMIFADDPWGGGMSADHSWDGSQPQQKSSRQVVVTLRDDQLGQLIGAISPPKKCHAHGPSVAHQPPAMASMSITTRPSAASLARKASYPELNQPSRSIAKPSPDKNYRAELTSEKENRLPTPFAHANRVPTPHPFASELPISKWDSDVSMRDTSSVLSNRSRFDKMQAQPRERKSSPFQTPPAGGGVKSRKEGPAVDPSTGIPLAHDNRHDQSLLPAVNDRTSSQDQKSFVPSHKSGMSSIDSTGRLERQLYSALGEELNHFNEDDSQVADIADATMTNLYDVDNPMTKRKRQGTFGAERDRSPMAKLARETDEKVEHSPPAALEMPHLRGGD